MMMRTIQLTNADLMPNADALKGRRLNASHYVHLIEDSTTVLKPDGPPLLIYDSDALSPRLSALALTFRNLPLHSSNRGMAAGGSRRPRKQDGTRSRTSQTKPVPSGALGFLPRAPREPYCRMTELTKDHYAEYKAAWPFVE